MKNTLRFLSAVIPIMLIAGLLLLGNSRNVGEAVERTKRPLIEHGDRLYSLDILADGKLWVVGSNGKIVYSIDQGENWNYARSPLTHAIQDIANWDSNNLVAVGNGGQIIISQDGGDNWSKVESPKSDIGNKLLSVTTQKNGIGWAVGEGGAVLKTEDYGKTWVRVRDEEDLAWNDIYVLGEYVWIAGEFGRLITSMDGGKQWHESESSIESSIMSISFKNINEGVAVGLGGVIAVTQDAGISWDLVSGDDTPEGNLLGGNHLFNVIWTGKQWFATGDNGFILNGDIDAANWDIYRVTGDDRNWYVAAAVENGFVYLAGSTYKKVPLNWFYSVNNKIKPEVLN